MATAGEATLKVGVAFVGGAEIKRQDERIVELSRQLADARAFNRDLADLYAREVTRSESLLVECEDLHDENAVLREESQEPRAQIRYRQKVHITFDRRYVDEIVYRRPDRGWLEPRRPGAFRRFLERLAHPRRVEFP
jgi:hypothetical protein